ncbi:hypothetical protein ACJJTC_016263 [Scirpophaga incertulas]
MGDDTAQDENLPSACNKQSQAAVSTEEIYKERRKREERRQDVSNSESFTTGSYSIKSRIEVTGAKPDIPKPNLAKRDGKTERKSSRKSGRVEKKRLLPKSQMRRAPRKQQRRKMSASTIFTKLSSQSGFQTPGCQFCGHRCCRRRYENKKRRLRRMYRKRIGRQRKTAIPKSKKLMARNQG